MTHRGSVSASARAAAAGGPAARARTPGPGVGHNPHRGLVPRDAEAVVIASVDLVVLIIIALVVSCAPLPDQLPDQRTRRTSHRRPQA